MECLAVFQAEGSLFWAAQALGDLSESLSAPFAEPFSEAASRECLQINGFAKSPRVEWAERRVKPWAGRPRFWADCAAQNPLGSLHSPRGSFPPTVVKNHPEELPD